MQVGIQLVVNDVDGKHSLKVGHPDNEQEKQMMYHYRYLVYRKNGLIQPNTSELDIDDYDEKSVCHYVITTFDDHIIGTLRVIYGKIIPMLDYYFDIASCPSIIAHTPREKIFEVGRIISTPQLVTHRVPQHFTLLLMFYYVVQFTKQYGFDLVVGGIKERIAKNLQKVKFPIMIIEGAKLNYNPAAHNDPLISFFNEEETGKVSSVYVPRKAAEEYFQDIFSRLLLTKEYTLKMEKSFIYNALSIYKELMRT